MEARGKGPAIAPDPTRDIAGVLGLECFLCGKPILGNVNDPEKVTFFGPKYDSELMQSGVVDLPCHTPCFASRLLPGRALDPRVVYEYRRRIAQMLGLPEEHA